MYFILYFLKHDSEKASIGLSRLQKEFVANIKIVNLLKLFMKISVVPLISTQKKQKQNYS